jgi:hypothetical protein
MKAKDIEELIISYCEGATDNVADGVLYKELSKILEAKFTSHNSECTVTQSEIASPKLTS